MVNQICIAGVVQGLAEGVDFAQRAGLDADQVVDVIGKGAAQSWQMENRAATMAAGEFDFGFAVEWMRKDLAFCLGEAARIGARLPVTALVDQFYAQVVHAAAGAGTPAASSTYCSNPDARARAPDAMLGRHPGTHALLRQPTDRPRTPASPRPVRSRNWDGHRGSSASASQQERMPLRITSPSRLGAR